MPCRDVSSRAGSHLVVSDCCQGHAADCPAGEARWLVWPFRGDGYLKRGAARRIIHRDFVKKGCSDGLAFHEASQTLVASSALNHRVDPTPSTRWTLITGRFVHRSRRAPVAFASWT